MRNLGKDVLYMEDNYLGACILETVKRVRIAMYLEALMSMEIYMPISPNPVR